MASFHARHFPLLQPNLAHSKWARDMKFEYQLGAGEQLCSFQCRWLQEESLRQETVAVSLVSAAAARDQLGDLRALADC